MALYLGSPETMRRGGEDALARGDTAAAVFFFARAIEIARDWTARDRPPYRRDAGDNAALFRRYVETLARVRMDRPGADVLSGHVPGNGWHTVAMMRAIAAGAAQAGCPAGNLDRAITRFAAVTAAGTRTSATSGDTAPSRDSATGV